MSTIIEMKFAGNYTPETIDTLCGQIRRHGSVELACEAAGVSLGEFNEWMNSRQGFKDLIDKAKIQFYEHLGSSEDELVITALKALKEMISGEAKETTHVKEIKKDATGAVIGSVERATVIKRPPNLRALEMFMPMIRELLAKMHVTQIGKILESMDVEETPATLQMANTIIGRLNTEAELNELLDELHDDILVEPEPADGE